MHNPTQHADNQDDKHIRRKTHSTREYCEGHKHFYVNGCPLSPLTNLFYYKSCQDSVSVSEVDGKNISWQFEYQLPTYPEQKT